MVRNSMMVWGWPAKLLHWIGAVLILRMTGPRKALAESALANLKITTQANEMQIRTEIPAASLASIVK